MALTFKKWTQGTHNWHTQNHQNITEIHKDDKLREGKPLLLEEQRPHENVIYSHTALHS